MKPFICLSYALVILCHASAVLGQPRPAPPASRQVPPTYGQLVSAGYDLLKEGKPKEAYVAAMMAASKEPKRFESYALAAAVLHVQGVNREARVLVRRALTLAPTNKKAPLEELAARIDKTTTAATTAGRPSPPRATSSSAATGLKKEPGGKPAGGAPATNRAPLKVRIASSSVGYVNVRREPNTRSAVVAKVRPGETYTASETLNGWYRLDGKAGWVAGRYVVVQ
jgi:uncharacterized protein YgiM (DUF1202 family)